MDNDEIGKLVLAFGRDNDGEVYILVKGTEENSGSTHRIE